MTFVPTRLIDDIGSLAIRLRDHDASPDGWRGSIERNAVADSMTYAELFGYLQSTDRGATGIELGEAFQNEPDPTALDPEVRGVHHRFSKNTPYDV